MAPLSETQTVLDWMQALALPVILVTGSYLGTISHTLTAISVLERAGIQIAALVVNESAPADMPLAEAMAGLAPFVHKIPLRIAQPRVSSWHEASATASLLEHL